MCLITGACAGRSDESLVFSIQQALATSSSGAAMAEVVAGDWDRLCVFTPNATASQVDSVTDSAVSAADRTSPAGYSLLAFMEGDRLERSVEYPLDKGEFAAPGPTPWYCLAKDAAVFEMRSPIDGSIPWIGPVGGS